MSGRRRIVYVTGTRADFGLMESTLHRLHADAALELALVVTGMHLSPIHGMTVHEVEASGLPVHARVELDHGAATGEMMARNIGRMLVGFVDAFVQLRPDVVLVLGDRGEMLAAAIAAIHLNIPVAHIHGGERSGTVDEPVRHAISKLSHLHLVATQESADRLVRMGEAAERISVVGAPGLDGIVSSAKIGKSELYARHGLDVEQPLALLLYHPVLQEAGSAGASGSAILDALVESGLQVLALLPNSDAGSDQIRTALQERTTSGQIALVSHLPREEYLSFLRWADVLVGNSSSGIIEAATFGIPVVNVGSRQNMRQRNANVVDVDTDTHLVRQAIAAALRSGRCRAENVYGDGRAGERIAALLAGATLDKQLMRKVNEY